MISDNVLKGALIHTPENQIEVARLIDLSHDRIKKGSNITECIGTLITKNQESSI